MFRLITVSLVGPFENHVGTYSIFLQHFQQTLLWPVRMDPQVPEEVFGVTNFVAALILVDLSYKQQISLLRFHTSDGHSRVEDICRFFLLSTFEHELHLVSSKLIYKFSQNSN